MNSATSISAITIRPCSRTMGTDRNASASAPPAAVPKRRRQEANTTVAVAAESIAINSSTESRDTPNGRVQVAWTT